MMRFVVFSDLDDTLLDARAYDFEAARPGLELLRRNRIPLVLLTSKTEVETLEFVDRLELEEPFAVENGGAVFIPRRYVSGAEDADFIRKGPYFQKTLGPPYAELRAFFGDFVERHRAPFRALTELPLEEGIRLTGLSREQARKALIRGYDLPFIVDAGGEDFVRVLAEEAASRSLTVVAGGRFFHLKGTADKGTAFDVLLPYYQRADGSLRTAGLGDSENDASFLAKVDIPVIIRRPDGRWNDRLVAAFPAAIKTENVGPEGWAEAVAAFILSGR